jgi:3-dehydroquinate synthase
MIGAFHQPNLVLADTALLDTLPDRELSAGLAEVIKYGLIRDTGFLDWLEASMARLLARDPAALAHAVRRSCEHKAEVVAADEREAGLRETLNLGHTFGHAIETGVGYGEWLHGEAVAAGTVLAATMSARLGWLDESEVGRVRRLFALARLPVEPPVMPAARWLDLMGHDKKVRGGRIRLVLLKGLGNALTSGDYDPAALDATLAEVAGDG